MRLFPEIKNLEEENLNDYSTNAFDGKIHVVDNDESMKEAVAYLLKCEQLGFDTETRPSFKKGLHYKVALLQLSDDKEAFLFRVQKTGIPDGLHKVLSSKKILKIGAAINDDLKSLKAIRDFNTTSFVDIQKIAKDLEIEHFGLKKLCPLVLGYKISKRQQLSNWENKTLNEAQQSYAATDAWVCYHLYNKLIPYTK